MSPYAYLFIFIFPFLSIRPTWIHWSMYSSLSLPLSSNDEFSPLRVWNMRIITAQSESNILSQSFIHFFSPAFSLFLVFSFFFLLRLQSFISSCSSSIRCVFAPFSLFLYSVPVSFSIVRLISLDEGRQIRRDLKLQKYEKKPFHSCYFFPNSFLSLFPSLHFPMLIFAFFSEAVFLASLQILQEWKGLELSPFFALYEKFWSQHHWITLKFEFMWRFCANRRRAMGIYVILLFCLVHLFCFLFIVLLREPSKEEGSNLSVLRSCDLFLGWECFAFRPIIY